MKLLVVVDMQNDFIDGSLGTNEARKIVDNVVNKIKNHTGMIAVTQDTHHSNYLKTQEGANLPVIHCVKNERGWLLNSKVCDALIEKTSDGTIVDFFNKSTFGCSEMGWYYGDTLARSNITEIELVGLCTDICVISNALILKAFCPEVPIYVDASCCAGVTPESHENALNAMKMCQIKVVNWGENENAVC